jgi:uncharacterized C2H2 Zn-finger protein
MVFYKCEKCNKEFNQKSNYNRHLNRKKSCILQENNNINLLEKYNNLLLENKNIKIENNKLLIENNKINELLKQYLINNNTITNTTNTTTTTNTTNNNTINITLNIFDFDNKLTENELLTICEQLASKQLQFLEFSNLMKYLDINDN